MSAGAKKDKSAGNSNKVSNMDEQGNWGIISSDKLYVYKTYVVEEDDFADDTGGHAVREYLVSRLRIPGCTPAQVSWHLEGEDLHVVFKMPKRICTLRDILRGKFAYQGLLWAQMTPEQRLPFAEKVAFDLLLPLAGLSSAGLIHQDLHDNNVVFNQTTGSFELIDFGFTCLFSTTQKRRADLMAWCPPPERVGPPSPVLLSADVWALGNIFVMCLRGTMPAYHQGGLAPSYVDGCPMHPNSADLENLRARFPSREWKAWCKSFFLCAETRLAACDMLLHHFPDAVFSSREQLRRRAWPTKLVPILLLANTPLSPALTLASLSQVSRMRSLCPAPKPPQDEGRVNSGCCGTRGRTRSSHQTKKCPKDKRRRRYAKPPLVDGQGFCGGPDS